MTLVGGARRIVCGAVVVSRKRRGGAPINLTLGEKWTEIHDATTAVCRKSGPCG